MNRSICIHTLPRGKSRIDQLDSGVEVGRCAFVCAGSMIAVAIMAIFDVAFLMVTVSANVG